MNSDPPLPNGEGDENTSDDNTQSFSPKPLIPKIEDTEWYTAFQVMKELKIEVPKIPHRNPIEYISLNGLYVLPTFYDVSLHLMSNPEYTKDFVVEVKTEFGSFQNTLLKFSKKALELFREYYEKFPGIFEKVSEGFIESPKMESANGVKNIGNKVSGVESEIALEAMLWVERHVPGLQKIQERPTVFKTEDKFFTYDPNSSFSPQHYFVEGGFPNEYQYDPRYRTNDGPPYRYHTAQPYYNRGQNILQPQKGYRGRRRKRGRKKGLQRNRKNNNPEEPTPETNIQNSNKPSEGIRHRKVRKRNGNEESRKNQRKNFGYSGSNNIKVQKSSKWRYRSTPQQVLPSPTLQKVKLKTGKEVYIDMNQVSPEFKPRGLVGKQQRIAMVSPALNAEEEEEIDGEMNMMMQQQQIGNTGFGVSFPTTQQFGKKKRPTSLKRAILHHRMKYTHSVVSYISSRDMGNRITTELQQKTIEFLVCLKKIQQDEWKKHQILCQSYQKREEREQRQHQHQTNQPNFQKFKKKKKKRKRKKPPKFDKRVVFGFSETIQKLRFFKLTQVKVVIFALDIEKVTTSKGTMERIELIKSMARECRVPVVFSLRRRKMGNCLGKPLKVSVVCVMNIKRAEKEFKDFMLEFKKEMKTKKEKEEEEEIFYAVVPKNNKNKRDWKSNNSSNNISNESGDVSSTTASPNPNLELNDNPEETTNQNADGEFESLLGDIEETTTATTIENSSSNSKKDSTKTEDGLQVVNERVFEEKNFADSKEDVDLGQMKEEELIMKHIINQN